MFVEKLHDYKPKSYHTPKLTQKNSLWFFLSEHQWSKSIKRIKSHPIEVRYIDCEGYLAIHHLCECGISDNVPTIMYAALINSFPHSLQMNENRKGFLPFHCAIRSNTSIHVIKLLLRHYSHAASIKNNYGNYPLHSYLLSEAKPSLDVIKVIVEAYPQAVSLCDKCDLWYPLHCASYHGVESVLYYLIDTYPHALLIKNRSGEKPIDIANNLGNETAFDLLSKEEKIHKLKLKNTRIKYENLFSITQV